MPILLEQGLASSVNEVGGVAGGFVSLWVIVHQRLGNIDVALLWNMFRMAVAGPSWNHRLPRA